jgi:uncharacterized membrane protein
MKTTSWIGIVLIILGVVALAYQGFSYTRQHRVLDMGPMHVTTETHEWVSLPPILGALALVGGIILVAMGARNKS